ncbi:hypothetical protein ACFL0J_02640 [Candidatus Neomarinimicrobiota bacterium]
MKIFNLLIVIFISIIFWGCATMNTISVLTDETQQYPSTKNVNIVNSPFQPYHIIAELETYGYNGESIPQLLNNMRIEAMSIGANAIIPTKENSQQFLTDTILDPWITEYQSIGGKFSIVRGLAIVYSDELKSDEFDAPQGLNKEELKSDEFITQQVYKKDLYYGAGINLLPIALNGIGSAGWIKYKQIRLNAEYFNLDLPSSNYSGGLNNGRAKDVFRIGIDYFFLKNSSGPYFPIGLEHWRNSIDHEQFPKRTYFETNHFSFGIGYQNYITENIYFDSRISMGTLLGKLIEVEAYGIVFLPRKITRSAMLGFGYSF